MNKETKKADVVKTAEEILNHAVGFRGYPSLLSLTTRMNRDSQREFILDCMREFASQQTAPLLSKIEGLEKKVTTAVENAKTVAKWYQTATKIVDDQEAKIASLEQQLTSGEWIRVEDRLPEFGEDYNVVLDLEDGGKPVSGIMEFDGITKKWLYPGTNVECLSVTHWQPLPTPPKKESEERGV